MQQTQFEKILHSMNKPKTDIVHTHSRDWNLRLHVLNTVQRKESGLEAQSSKAVILKVARWSTVPKELIGSEVDVHNGKSYARLKITKERVGYRFGEFVTTTAWSTGAKKEEAKPTAKGKAQGKSKK